VNEKERKGESEREKVDIEKEIKGGVGCA